MAEFIRVEEGTYLNLDAVERIYERPGSVQVMYINGKSEYLFGEKADAIRGILRTPVSVEELPG